MQCCGQRGAGVWGAWKMAGQNEPWSDLWPPILATSPAEGRHRGSACVVWHTHIRTHIAVTLPQPVMQRRCSFWILIIAEENKIRKDYSTDPKLSPSNFSLNVFPNTDQHEQPQPSCFVSELVSLSSLLRFYPFEEHSPQMPFCFLSVVQCICLSRGHDMVADA